MATELFSNNTATTVSSGGTTAPASGTVETWTVASSASFPAAVTGASQFHVADPAQPAEKILVTNVSGTTWTVTRGTESTTPVAHPAGFTVNQVVTAGALTALAANSGIPMAFMPNVGITTTGASFTPYIALSSGSAATAYFVYNGAVAALGPGPAAPAVANAATGGTVAAGTYKVQVAYVMAAGETIPSLPVFTVTTGTTSTITVTSPAAATGATGYYVYCTAAGGSSFFRQQAAGSPTAIGTNYTLTAPPGTSGANPLISFGSSATRTVQMYVTDSGGFSALDQVTIFNIGYDNTLDTSFPTAPWSPGAAYNLAAQAVSGLARINLMTGLQWFLAEQVTGLATTLDFTGMSRLQVIDCYASSALPGVILSGNASLQRLDVELCSVTNLDLNPVADSLCDLRTAKQFGTTNNVITFAPLTRPLTHQYHYCVHDNIIIGAISPAGTQSPIPQIPDPSLRAPDPNSQLPAAHQIWNYNTQQYGLLKPTSVRLDSIESANNWYAKLDVSGVFPFGAGHGGFCELTVNNNQLTSVNLTGAGGLQIINLQNNPFTQATVDSILTTVNSWGTSGGTLNLGTTAAPSSTGTTAKTALTGRSWTVTTDASGALGGGFGSKYTYGETAIAVALGTGYLQATLVTAVSTGDLLVAGYQVNGTTPAIYDSSGNTWTVTGPYHTNSYLAYCTAPAASAGGLTVYVYSQTSANTHALCVSRFTPSSTAVFGAAASNTPDPAGIGSGSNMGNLGTVPANALVWGAMMTPETGKQAYTAGFQTGTSGTVDFLGATMQGPGGTALVAYVPGAANANATLNWNGTGGAGGYSVSAYFT